MIPADFDYVAPDTLEDALRALADGGEDAKVLAGGHSLIPLMKLRLASPSLLVDLRKVPGLSGIERTNGTWRVGAMTTHHAVNEGGLGLASKVAGTIADQQIRNCGTLGGTMAHGDPASDLPAVMMALEATVTAMSPGGGSREIPATEFFTEFWETALEPHEIITEVHVPALEGYGYAYEKFNRRQEDWAMVAVSVAIKVESGACSDVRVGLTHMGTTPLRATAVEEALRGQQLSPEAVGEAASHAADGTSPPSDLNASVEYKQHLARVLCQRALEQAVALCVASPTSKPRSSARPTWPTGRWPPPSTSPSRSSSRCCSRARRASARPRWPRRWPPRPARG
ncbi:MAG: aerobic carbon-monoxide dehydrogenase medium subunit [Gaiellaceae bacterium]|nr:aerobic carbon-monoxide dehydrogenase medium subunit [Gaiellaceae bacterium]